MIRKRFRLRLGLKAQSYGPAIKTDDGVVLFVFCPAVRVNSVSLVERKVLALFCAGKPSQKHLLSVIVPNHSSLL